MGLVNSALQIGKSAITSYQGAISLVGNNIANAADPDYTRQQAILEPLQGAALPQGIKPGGGVVLSSLERVIDEALEERLRDAISAVERQRVGSQLMGEIESAFNEFGDSSLSAMVNDLFNSFLEVQTDPSNIGVRSVLLGQAEALAAALNARREGLAALADGIGEQLMPAAERADKLAQQIADLNVEVVASEADGQTASALRDQRDALLRELSEMIEITVRQQEGGSVNVFIGNEMLVQYGNSRGLMVSSVVQDGVIRYELRFRDNEGVAGELGGIVGGLIDLQDSAVGHIIDLLDQMAAGLISAINRIHANGQGLSGYDTLISSNVVDDPDAALDNTGTGLALVPQTGSFFMAVTDTVSGRTEAYRIDVDLDGAGGDDTTLNSLVATINDTVANVTASVSADNRLQLVSEQGFTFSFGHDGVESRDDTSLLLAALGVNTLFSGSSAGDIQVIQQVLDNPELLAAASVPFHGEGVNASMMADVRDAAQVGLDDQSVADFLDQMIVELGSAGDEVNSALQSAESVLAALRAQRASISGVNLDEEAVNLLRYERAFQGAARYTSIVDELIAEMLNIAR